MITNRNQPRFNHASIRRTYLARMSPDKALNCILEETEFGERNVDRELHEEPQNRLVGSGTIDDAKIGQRSIRVGRDFIGNAKHTSCRKEINIFHKPAWAPHAIGVDLRVADVNPGITSKVESQKEVVDIVANRIYDNSHLSPTSYGRRTRIKSKPLIQLEQAMLIMKAKPTMIELNPASK
jgi:hypothetical protein